MPAKPITINLLGNRNIDNSPIGRILQWATTYGRYIMVGTEIIVLLAFISRFSLDRKRTDLKEEISQKQAVIEVNEDLVNTITHLQARLVHIQSILDDQKIPYSTYITFLTLIPSDVIIDSYQYNTDSITISATAGTTQGFTQFLVNLQTQPSVHSIDLQEITRQKIKGIRFSLAVKFNSQPIKAQ